nr:hypothetical protein [Polyangiaceae bacterium]
VIVDRCYIHGYPEDESKRGVQLNSGTSAVIDSYISDIHNVGQDTQAICGWNGPGPFKIVNNYLEGATENVMFGGATPAIPGMIPSDIEIRRNHFFKPLTWKSDDPSYQGRDWSIKNLLEFKIAQRVLVEGNVFENNWADSQAGMSILLTPRTEDGAAPWVVTSHIQFVNNVLRGVAGGVNISGRDDNGQGATSCVRFANNLFESVGGEGTLANGRLFQVLNGPSSVTIEHNTAFQSSHIAIFDGPKGAGLVVRDNIAPHNEYGLFGSGVGTGTASLEAFFSGYEVTGNVFPWAQANPAVYPPGNFFPADLAQVGFVNLAGKDFRLAPGSAYKGKGSGGKDPGADLDGVLAATAGVVK